MEFYSLTAAQLIELLNDLLEKTEYSIVLANGKSFLVYKEWVISDFILIPIAAICKISQTSSQHSVKVAILKDGQLSNPIPLEADDIFKYRSWHKIWGFQTIGVCEKSTADHLRTVFGKLACDTATERLYRYTGWNAEGNSFLLGNLKIAKDAVEQVEHLEMNTVSFDPKLSEKDAMEFMTTHYLKALNPCVYMQILFAYVAVFQNKEILCCLREFCAVLPSAVRQR